MTSDSRSPASRQLAERALVRLAIEVGERRDQLIVIGGLNPALLTRAPSTPHQGTNDVDILISVGLPFDRDDMDFSWLEEALTRLGYIVDPLTGDGWRWIAATDGFSIKVEFLCDVPGDQGNYTLALPGCARASARNLQGPGAALNDSRLVDVAVPAELGGGVVTLRFAGLGGYLMAKAAAVSSRQLDRDFYDFAFVLLFNTAGGPAAAAGAVSDSEAVHLLGNYRRFVSHTVSLYVEGERRAAHAYALEMRRSGDETDHDVLVEDAASAAMEFWSSLPSD